MNGSTNSIPSSDWSIEIHNDFKELLEYRPGTTKVI